MGNSPRSVILRSASAGFIDLQRCSIFRATAYRLHEKPPIAANGMLVDTIRIAISLRAANDDQPEISRKQPDSSRISFRNGIYIVVELNLIETGGSNHVQSGFVA